MLQDNMTVGEWLTLWLKYYVLPSKLAQNTISCYNRSVAAVPPELAAVPLRDLSPLDVLIWVQSVAVKYPRAAQLDRVMMSKALKVARKLRLTDCILDEDTCPQVVHKAAKAVVLDYQQLCAYMDAARKTDVAPILLLCCCGLRRGEAMGARRADFAPVEGVLTVSVQRLYGLEELPLKSAASHRAIMLPPMVADCLRRWPLSMSGYFCDVSAAQVYRAHKAIVAELGLPPVTLHGLRHSLAAAAACGGVPIKLLQGCLGHARYKLTADLYADHLPVASPVCVQVFAS